MIGPKPIALPLGYRVENCFQLRSYFATQEVESLADEGVI